jgi:hypothetical protein
MLKRKLIWSPQSKIELLEILEFYKKRNGNAEYSRKLYTQYYKNMIECFQHGRGFLLRPFFLVWGLVFFRIFAL